VDTDQLLDLSFEIAAQFTVMLPVWKYACKITPWLGMNVASFAIRREAFLANGRKNYKSKN
jgi:hypothetical protein